jgi:hypothetical protein
MTIDRARRRWNEDGAKHSIGVAMDFAKGWLVFGAGTRLAKIDADMSPRERARLIALLTAAHRRPIAASGLRYLERALKAKRDGDIALAHMHIALSRLGTLARPREDARRMFVIEALIDDGVEPNAILKGFGVDSAENGPVLDKYSPDQPRVPAGAGRASGRWKSGDWTAEAVDGAAAQAESASQTGAPPLSARGPKTDIPPDLTAAQAETATGQLVLGPGQWNRADIQEFLGLINDPTVKAAIETAWRDSTADPQHVHETGFFVVENPETGAISVQWVAPGFAGAIRMAGAPSTTIATFHTHPNPTGTPVIINGQQVFEQGEPVVYLPGPSAADMSSAYKAGLAGIVESDRGLYFYGPLLRRRH